MPAHPVVFLPGDGIGPEVASAARRVVDASGVEVSWIDRSMGLVAFEDAGTRCRRTSWRPSATRGSR